MLVAHPDPGAGRSVESRMEPFVVVGGEPRSTQDSGAATHKRDRSK